MSSVEQLFKPSYRIMLSTTWCWVDTTSVVNDKEMTTHTKHLNSFVLKPSHFLLVSRVPSSFSSESSEPAARLNMYLLLPFFFFLFCPTMNWWLTQPFFYDTWDKFHQTASNFKLINKPFDSGSVQSNMLLAVHNFITDFIFLTLVHIARNTKMQQAYCFLSFFICCNLFGWLLSHTLTKSTLSS